MMAQKLSLVLVVESVFIDLYISCLTVIQQKKYVLRDAIVFLHFVL